MVFGPMEIHFHLLIALLELVLGARMRKFSFAIVRIDHYSLPYGITPTRGDIADANIHVHCFYLCLSVMTLNPAHRAGQLVTVDSDQPCSPYTRGHKPVLIIGRYGGRCFGYADQGDRDPPRGP